MKERDGSPRRLGFALFAALVVAGALAACGSDDDGSGSGGDGSEPLEIGLMVWTSAPYYEVVIDGAEDEAEKLGVDLTVSNASGNISREVSIIEQYIAQDMDAIIAIASDSEGIVPVIKQANAANIPVIASQTAVSEGAETVAYVGADNVEYGRRLADATAEAIGGEGSVAMILGQLGSSPQIDRKEGFVQQIEAEYPDISLIDEQSAAWDYQEALRVTQDFLSKYPNGELDAIVDQGPEGVSGAEYAAKNGREEVSWIVGDIPTEVSDAITSGVIDAAVYQNPIEQGRLATRDAVDAANGETDIPNPHLTDIVSVTKENLGDINPYDY